MSRYQISTFHFTDEIFTSNKTQIREICSLIIDRKLKVSWVCSARAQKLDKETLFLMKEAGCREISFGIESGNPKILANIDKKLDIKEIEQTIKLVKKVGITTHASFILGYLGETEETIKDTLKFAQKLNPDIAAFFIASPLPGTRFYQQAYSRGLLRENLKWIDYSPLSDSISPINLPGLSAAEIKRWRGRAMTSFYLRPKFLIGRLMRIRSWCEVINLFEGFRMFLRLRHSRHR